LETVRIEAVEGVDGSSLGFRDEVDRGLGCREAVNGLLAGLFGLVLGQVAPDGGNGDDEFEGSALDHALAQLLAQGIHEMVAEGRHVVGDELVDIAASTGGCTRDCGSHGLERGIEVAGDVSKRASSRGRALVTELTA
jgi:hypothetical protein